MFLGSPNGSFKLRHLSTPAAVHYSGSTSRALVRHGPYRGSGTTYVWIRLMERSAPASLLVVSPPSVTTASPPGGTGGSAYNAALQESGGGPPFSWSLSSGSLPTGFTLGTDGTIAGTPCLKQHLSNDFPNPTRIGCPPLEALECNTKDPIHADESVSKHVGHCSPCYRAYSRLLREELARIRPPVPRHKSNRGTHKKI